MINFSIQPEVSALGVKGGYFVISGMKNTVDATEFDAFLATELREITSTITAATLTDDPVLQGFRQLHEKVGVSNRKNISAPEQLVGVFLRHGVLPRINPLVDLYNLVSLKTRLALGAHDIAKVQGSISLRMTTGTEKFQPLGQAESRTVPKGAYAYVDDANDILCWLEVKQVEKSKVSSDCAECFYIVQGNSQTTSETINAACEELIALTLRWCGGRSTILHSA